MTCVEFEEAMQAKHGYNHTIVSIGPTAENGVRYSAICSEAGRAAGRGGCAVVMGAKKLKGVVVYGDQSLPYAGSKEEYKALFEEMQQLTFSHKTYGDKRQWGSVATLTNNSNAGTCSVRNHREGTNPYDDVIGTVALYLNYFVRHRSCHACPIRCMKTGVAKDGNYKGTIAEGPEYEAAMNGANWLIDNLSDYSGVMQYIEEQGFDLINVGGTVGYALEAYENGVIKSSDIDGIKLEWGNAAEILKFMDKLIYGKGEIWDWFRGGSSYAAWKLDNKLGTQSASYAVDVKNHSFAAHGLQGQAARTMLQSAYSFSNRGACHCAGVNVAGQNNGMIQNMAVSCSRGGTGFMGYPNIVRCMNFVLDKNLTQTDYALIGEKAWNMEKVFNVMNGFRKEDDQLPDRVFDDALTWGPMAGSHMDRDAWAVEWNKYYEQRGWDTETSAPTEGKLQELGLDELIPYLRKALA